MTEVVTLEPINILLSREELLLVLELLQAESLPGLDADPLGELSPEGRDLALTVAGRGLMARDLAQLGEDGQLSVHSALLTAVGVCAYSTNTVFVFHWPETRENPIRYFGHVREDDVAAHSRPDDVLHLFTLLPSKDHLIEQVLAFCEFRDVPQTGSFEMAVAGEDFVQVRQLASNGSPQEAVDLLVANGAGPESAAAFVSTLAGSPRVSILQTLTQEGEDEVLKRDFTMVQDSQHTWFIGPTAAESEDLNLVIRLTTREEIESLLAESL
jgi:hypothetical protein